MNIASNTKHGTVQSLPNYLINIGKYKLAGRGESSKNTKNKTQKKGDKTNKIKGGHKGKNENIKNNKNTKAKNNKNAKAKESNKNKNKTNTKTNTKPKRKTEKTVNTYTIGREYITFKPVKGGKQKRISFRQLVRKLSKKAVLAAIRTICRKLK